MPDYDENDLPLTEEGINQIDAEFPQFAQHLLETAFLHRTPDDDDVAPGLLSLALLRHVLDFYRSYAGDNTNTDQTIIEVVTDMVDHDRKRRESAS